jgi:hypothetical protein
MTGLDVLWAFAHNQPLIGLGTRNHPALGRTEFDFQQTGPDNRPLIASNQNIELG